MLFHPDEWSVDVIGLDVEPANKLGDSILLAAVDVDNKIELETLDDVL